MLPLDFKIRFFDCKRVIAAVDRESRRVLARSGGLIRRIAKISIHKREGAAPPGQPPHSHLGYLKRLIFFAHEDKSVIVGPVGFRRSKAPHTLEYGGAVRSKHDVYVRERGRERRDKRGRYAKRGAKLKKVAGKGKLVTYSPRPYMGPAAEKARPKLPKHWADSIKAS